MMTAEELAELFHATYERLAPEYAYKTREASAVPWSDVPENNKRLMIAVCAEILQGRSIPLYRTWEEEEDD
jgi:oligoendopeptidase F